MLYISLCQWNSLSSPPANPTAATKFFDETVYLVTLEFRLVLKP